MPSIPLHISLPPTENGDASSPLPSFFSTPSGLAIVEIQGTIHAPSPSQSNDNTTSFTTQTPIGHLVFPDYDPATPDDTKWMKTVYLYVGQHQRLVGEVKKLLKPIAVLRKQNGAGHSEGESGRDAGADAEQEALEIAEVVKYKILFQGRPEPV